MAKKQPRAVNGPSGDYRFEVTVYRDGRWTIDGVVSDEASARSRAQALVNSRSCQEVKVTRQLQRGGQEGFSSEILHLKVKDKGSKTFALSGDPAKAPICKSLEDFYRWETRRFIASLLRGYLQHHAIIPSELLFNWRHAKALLESGSLPYDAARRVAAAQAERQGEPSEPRMKALEGMLEEAAKRSADLQAAGRAFLNGKSLQGNDLPPLKGVSGREARTLAAACISDQLARIGHLEGKIDTLAELLPNAGQGWFTTIEEMLAECLLSSESLTTLFPQLVDRISLILALADLVEGRDTAPAIRRAPKLAALAKMIGLGSAPHCQSVLEAWMVPIIRGREPLDRNNPAKEVQLIDQLGRRIRRSDGSWIGGEAVAKAVELRKARTREKTLRSLGMDTAADALGRAAARG